VHNPATEVIIANVPEADKADVDLAVAAARRAFDEGRWTKISRSERGRMMWRLADLIERDLEELAELESLPLDVKGPVLPSLDDERER
jgi:phenylacetaldehyde dehydrogenase